MNRREFSTLLGGAAGLGRGAHTRNSRPRHLTRFGGIGSTGAKKRFSNWKALSTQIEIAIVDLTMPGGEGNEIARRFRHLNPKLKVIATSGYPEPEVRAKFGDLMDAFLPKPYRSQHLREIVSSVLAG
jgi:DNA-binding NarL/FixJ family response regulator